MTLSDSSMTVETELSEPRSLSRPEAEIVKAELDRIASSGGLTPEAVVKAARNPKSVLHDYFTWDDKEAAFKRRLDEARHLIQKVKIIIQTTGGETYSVRGFLSISEKAISDEPGATHYVPRKLALGKKAHRAQMIAKARQELENWCQRWVDVGELSEIRDALSSLLKDD